MYKIVSHGTIDVTFFPHHPQQEEILRFIYNLLTSCPCQFVLGEQLWEKGIPILVLIRGQSMPVRLLAIKVGHVTL